MAGLEQRQRSTRISGYLPAIIALGVLYLIVYSGLVYYEQRDIERELLSFTQKAANALEMMSFDADAEQYWLRTLIADFQVSSDHKEFMTKLRQHRVETGRRLKCIVWDANGRVVENDRFDPANFPECRLEELFKDICKIYEVGRDFPDEDLKRLRSLLGPQIDSDKLAAALYFRHFKFIRPDSAGHYPEFWLAWSPKFATIVFFERSMMNDDVGLVRFARKNAHRNFQLGFIKESGNPDRKSKWFDAAVRTLEKEGRSAALISGIFFTGKRIADGRTLIACRRFVPLLEPGKLSCMLAMIGFFCLALIMRGTGFSLDRRSVKLQILFMLAVTTGLPLLLLTLAASDHVSRKRNALVESAYQTCISYIQHVDRRSLTINSSIIHKVNRLLPDIRQQLPQKFGSSEIMQEFKKQFGDSLLYMRLIASSPAKLMSEFGILDGNRFIAFEKVGKPVSKALLDLKVARDIAASYMSEMNGSATGNKLTETELVAEMVYQRPFHEIIQSMMLATDKIFMLGLVDRTSPLLVKLISLNNDVIIDYFLMIFFQNRQLQEKFLLKHLSNFTRNPFGLKFMYSNGSIFNQKENITEGNRWFAEIFFKTREHPAVNPCFVNFDGQDYVYAGMRAPNLDNYCLYAFYPLERIEAEINEERNFMLSAGLMTVVMLLGLGIIFSASFVLPLTELQNGALAIRQRDFSFRLSELADDEFGEMARIFNSSIADFEELSLAGIVQSRLLPQQGVYDARFDLFGKNIPMTELGGDYFDYFKADDGNYVIVTGDVAGHGVGASLIMAMAKAGILRCRECLHDPASVLARLHQIVHETRTRAQRKVMTFQYLYYNADNGAGVYSNAGACSPFLVDKNKELAQEINLQGPVLGGFKKSRFANIDLQLAPGQALVFYTDGIIEAINSAGKEIGYEGFRQILLDCYDQDAQKYYDKVYNRYLQWLGNQRSQDDITLVVLIRR